VTHASPYQNRQGRSKLSDTITAYDQFYAADDGCEQEANNRKEQYAKVVDAYYNVVTDFYEFGWGDSFHFAPRFRGESLAQSIARHEHWLGLRLNLQQDQHALDVGCGVGGPMRAIARFSGAEITGITINGYQVERAQAHNRNHGLSNRCHVVKGDFMSMAFADEQFDKAYAIEATCHAPDRLGVFSEIFRALKKGGLFASYEWCLTDAYDSSNPEHRAVKHGIEAGDGLPNLVHTSVVDKALGDAGFDLVETRDLAFESDPATPWYQPLDSRLSLSGFRHTRLGRWITHHGVRAMEATRLAPKGSTDVSSMLMCGAKALLEGGKMGIFTPMHFVLARKG